MSNRRTMDDERRTLGREIRKKMPFEESHLYDEVPFDPSKGYPGHFGLYYRCPLCGDIIRSNPPTSMACGCGNLLIEVGQMRVRHADRQPTLLKKKNIIKRLLHKKSAS